MLRHRIVLGTFLALGAVGCAHATILNESFRPPPTCTAAITVYASKEKAPADYREIAILSSGFGLDALKKKAAEVGATGLILTGTTSSTSGGVTVGRTTTPITTTTFDNAVAIHSVSDSAAVRAACAGQK